jgi:hypothetical protein
LANDTVPCLVPRFVMRSVSETISVLGRRRCLDRRVTASKCLTAIDQLGQQSLTGPAVQVLGLRQPDPRLAAVDLDAGADEPSVATPAFLTWQPLTWVKVHDR